MVWFHLDMIFQFVVDAFPLRNFFTTTTTRKDDFYVNGNIFRNAISRRRV